jgi:hypothetical protein
MFIREGITKRWINYASKEVNDELGECQGLLTLGGSKFKIKLPEDNDLRGFF